MEKYPDYETYRALYARYYDRAVEDLLRLLDPLEGTSVVDLCGGDGRLTLKMIESGASSVLLVDAESEMVPSTIWQHKSVQVIIEEVRFALSEAVAKKESFDRIICQQAVNYWLDEDTARIVAQALNPGGVFAFNTFNQRPSEKPRVLEYEIDEHKFVEVSWLVDDKIHHLQVRDGMSPHHTVFKWLSPERLRELLEPHFTIHEERHQKTTLYRCEKKV